jgi:ectoine hydroxylase
MTQTDFALDNYEKEGFALLQLPINTCPENHLIQNILKDNNIEKVYEADGETLRSIYGLQFNADFNSWLQNQHWVEDIVKKILGENVYLHQTKVNYKNQINSAVWPYHRDFPFWHFFDHIPKSNMLNMAIYLDEATTKNGALQLIPQSHKLFLESEKRYAEAQFSIEGSSSATLLFDIKAEELSFFREKYGEKSSEGAKGAVLLFHPDVIHGSGASSQNQSRRLLILTWNRCDNTPTVASIRPQFLCSTNYQPFVWQSKT